MIDGVDTASVGLHALRQSLAILPQTPLVFPGTVGHNLDPFNRNGDTARLKCLRRVGLFVGRRDPASQFFVCLKNTRKKPTFVKYDNCENLHFWKCFEY